MKRPRTFWRNDGGRRLTVLVADDNALILEKASALLARDFDLVAAVTDGRQALDAARRLDPDVAVLDVTMPELDGFQTARELKRAGSRAKIVMLTMHQSDDYVAAAFKSGAQGYVSKTRMHFDLASAIDHAVAGRLFVPSLTSLLPIAQAGSGGHALQLHTKDGASLDELSRLLSAALHRGDVTAIVATDATRAAVAQRLNAMGCDIAQAGDRGKYISLDAAGALSQMIVDGRLDASRLVPMIDGLERSRLAASASHLTIVGEMSGLLCRDGNPRAAMQLEQAWDAMTRGLPFFTVCFYSMECFSEGRDPELFPSVCASHGSVCHAHDA